LQKHDTEPVSKYAGRGDSSEIQPLQAKSAGLVVDVQLGGLQHLDEKGAKNYLDSIAKSVRNLRDSNTPVIWVTMSDRNEIYPPEKGGNGNAPRSAAQMQETDFTRSDPNNPPKHQALFDKFLKDHGPRRNEAVMCKQFFDLFTKPEDAKTDPAYAKHMEGQTGIPLDKQKKTGNGMTAEKYLENVKDLKIMGGNAGVCVMETAIGAAQRGKKAEIMAGAVTDRDDPQQSGQKREGFFKQKIKNRLDKILNRPGSLKNDPTHKHFSSGRILAQNNAAAIGRNISFKTGTSSRFARSKPAVASAAVSGRNSASVRRPGHSSSRGI